MNNAYGSVAYSYKPLNISTIYVGDSLILHFTATVDFNVTGENEKGKTSVEPVIRPSFRLRN